MKLDDKQKRIQIKYRQQLYQKNRVNNKNYLKEVVITFLILIIMLLFFILTDYDLFPSYRYYRF